MLVELHDLSSSYIFLVFISWVDADCLKWWTVRRTKRKLCLLRKQQYDHHESLWHCFVGLLVQIINYYPQQPTVTWCRRSKVRFPSTTQRRVSDAMTVSAVTVQSVRPLDRSQLSAVCVDLTVMRSGEQITVLHYWWPHVALRHASSAKVIVSCYRGGPADFFRVWDGNRFIN